MRKLNISGGMGASFPEGSGGRLIIIYMLARIGGSQEYIRAEPHHWERVSNLLDENTPWITGNRLPRLHRHPFTPEANETENPMRGNVPPPTSPATSQLMNMSAWVRCFR